MDSVRTEYQNISLEQLLTQNVTALLGVNAAAGAALDSLSIKTIFDLATSDVFAAAKKLADAASDSDSVLYRHGALTTDLVRASVAGGKPIIELQCHNL